MKTLSINPFNCLKTAIRKDISSKKPVKHVEIPATLPKELGNELLALQPSLDYMATKFGFNFEIGYDCDDSWIKISKGDSNYIVYTNDYDQKLIRDNIYSSVSKALAEENKESEEESEIIKTQIDLGMLESFVKKYKGLLEFYNKFYKGMIFEVNEFIDGFNIESIFGEKKLTCNIKHNEIDNGYSKIYQMIKNITAVSEPQPATVPKLPQ